MSEQLEIWVQNALPEEDELVFNVHFRSKETVEWEVHIYNIPVVVLVFITLLPLGFLSPFTICSIRLRNKYAYRCTEGCWFPFY
jgi:hypothetical protein